MIVFIDGENFRQRLTTVLLEANAISKYQPFKYNLRGLFEDILNDKNIEIKYYHSRVKLPKGYIPDDSILDQITKIREAKRVWQATLIPQNIEIIKAGNLKIKTGKKCRNCHTVQDIVQEKGVDVRLSLDILEVAMAEGVSEIAVASSDTDICPAYHKARKHGTKVFYICFDTAINRAVSSATSETILISTEKAVKYLDFNN